jgi:hypothetical protein
MADEFDDLIEPSSLEAQPAPRTEAPAAAAASEFDDLIEPPPEPPKTLGETAWDVAKAFPKGFNRGLANVATFPYWMIDNAGEYVTGGDFLPNIEEAPGWDYMFEGAKPETTAGRYAASTGEAVGASALPTAGLMAAAPRLSALAPTTALRSAAQQTGQQIAQAPGRAVAVESASAIGAGTGQQFAAEEGAGPVGQAVGALVGGMAPLAALSAPRNTMNAVNRARANMGSNGAYGSIADDMAEAPSGAIRTPDDLSRSIAMGSGPGGVAGRNRQMDLGILGEEMVRANGNVQRAQQAAARRIAQEAGITVDRAQDRLRDLSRMYEDSPLSFAEAPSVDRGNAALRGGGGGLKNSENVVLDDLKKIDQSAPQATLDYLANQGNAPSAVFIRNQLTERHDQLGPTMRRVLERIGPQVETGPRSMRPATIDDAGDMIENARQAGGQAYDAARAQPIRERIVRRGMPAFLSQFQRRANMRAGESRAAINRALNEFVDPLSDNGAPIMDLQRLQDARGAVRGQITEYFRAGRDDLVNAVQPMYDRITDLMSRANPQWAEANRLWADMNFDRMAAELGDVLVKRASPRYRQQMREFQQLAPEAQDIVRIHWLQQQYDKLANLGDDHSIVKLFTTDHARRSIEDFFGRQAAVDFTRAVRDIKTAEKSTGAMRNSATHRRGVEERRRNIETGLVSSADRLSLRGLQDWMLERTQQILNERRNRPLSRILSTPLRDTPDVAMHLERLRQQQALLDSFNRRPGTEFLRPLGTLTGVGISNAREVEDQ